MPRLFTGLEIPGEIALALAELRGGIHGARWIEPENYHITLRFIGDVELSEARMIADALDEIHRPRLVVAFEGLSSFGADKPRAVIAKVRATPPLVELQAEHERRLRRIGAEPQTRKFTPHVTLARLRGASPLAVAGYLSHRALLGERRFEAARFVLYSAKDWTGGGPYLVEAAYTLD
jgi:2'-5' RNA ligase